MTNKLLATALLALICSPSCTCLEPRPRPGVGRKTAATPSPLGKKISSGDSAKKGNHLVGQRSLYLRQHAHNPVNWYPWGEEALALAKKKDRPIFLSIGYASCHWCHVMEKEVFEHEDVAKVLNEQFVSIKVDREERPDLDMVYMNAVQAMSGSGGWPMSVFLTPDLKPFFGGTYFPKARFLALLSSINQAFKTRRDDLEHMGARLQKAIARDTLTAGGKLPGDQLLKRAYQVAMERVDPRWGGETGRMKFPQPTHWLAMLHRIRRTGDKEMAAAVSKTLDFMASGGMQDHLAGGFHRYTTEPTWMVPHFEKMLYDNAQLAGLYLSASSILGRRAYAGIARQTLDFMIREMQEESGGFFASFDADSGGEEGSFYVWTPGQLEALAGPADGPVLARLLGVTPGGNFEGKSILSRRSTPGKGALAALERWRQPLLKARAGRPSPGLDKKVITAWNGLALIAMARGYQVLGERRYLDAGRRAAEFLWATHRQPGGSLLRSSNGGIAQNEGVLDDYALVAMGFVALHQADGGLKHLERALALVEQLRARFAHGQACFYLTPSGHEAPLGRQVPLHDGVRPSGNGALLQTMLALSALTGKEAYRKEVVSCLAAQGGAMAQRGLGMSLWLDLLDRVRGPYYEVVIAGDAEMADTKALLSAYRKLDPHHAVLAKVPGAGPDSATLKLIPVTEEKRALEGKATAYVCKLGACKAPTHDPATLRRQLLEGWKR